MVSSKWKESLIISFWALGSGLCSSCAFLSKYGPTEPTASPSKQVANGDSTKPEHAFDRDLSMRDERDLKVAKLWARVDELEEEVYRQKERIVVLERGLTLGLVPEELKYPERSKVNKTDRKVVEIGEREVSKSANTTAKHDDPEAVVAVTNSSSLTSKSPVPGSAEVSSPQPKENQPVEKVGKTSEFKSAEDREAYELAAATAHDSFRSGRYGRAIVEYSAIGKKYGDQVGGAMHLYWIAKSWASLKEFNTSRQLFTEFIKKHADSPWTPRAKLDLGRVEWQLGMRESALATFRSVVQQYPLADAAEMARMELENLDKKL